MIEIKDLSKRFGDKKVLEKLNINVPEGETLVILGKSGIGKSVLIKCIVRLIEPEEGEIFIGGTNVLKLDHKKLNNIRKEIGFLFQSGALYDSMTVKENLAFPLEKHFRLSRSELNSRVEEALSWVSLNDAINKMPSELSGGMRKRIALARTLIMKPKIVLFDEPTTGLDPITTKEITKLIVELQEKFRMTNIVVTHDLIVANGTADNVIMLNEGKAQFEGNIDSLYSSKDNYIKDFLSNQISGLKEL